MTPRLDALFAENKARTSPPPPNALMVNAKRRVLRDGRKVSGVECGFRTALSYQEESREGGVGDSCSGTLIFEGNEESIGVYGAFTPLPCDSAIGG